MSPAPTVAVAEEAGVQGGVEGDADRLGGRERRRRLLEAHAVGRLAVADLAEDGGEQLDHRRAAASAADRSAPSSSAERCCTISTSVFWSATIGM